MTSTARPPQADHNIRQQIKTLIREIESRNEIGILLAVEQGSRAWGLDSISSDIDIRFIYRERAEQAFALYRDRDALRELAVLETDRGPVDIEMSGWALQKALRLAAGSNPQIGEMAHAQIAWHREDRFQKDLLDLSAHASPRVLAHAYLGTAKKNLMGKIPSNGASDIKTTLQMIRDLFNAIWFVQNPDRGGFPPLDFETLRRSFDLTGRPIDFSGRHHELLQREIDDLVALKRSGTSRKTDRKFTFVFRWGLSQVEALDREVMEIPDIKFDRERVEAVFRRQYPAIFRNRVTECDLSEEI